MNVQEINPANPVPNPIEVYFEHLKNTNLDNYFLFLQLLSRREYRQTAVFCYQNQCCLLINVKDKLKKDLIFYLLKIRTNQTAFTYEPPLFKKGKYYIISLTYQEYFYISQITDLLILECFNLRHKIDFYSNEFRRMFFRKYDKANIEFTSYDV